MTNYQAIAQKIYDDVGGSGNIVNINHCATRLRLRVIDVNKINDDEINKLDGVAGTVKHDQEYQIVIGTDVAKVYNEFTKFVDNKKENTKKSQKTKLSWSNLGHTIIDFISGTFVPILGVLVAAGLVSAVLNIATSFFGLNTKSGTYTVLYAIYQAGYYFLPLYLGYSAARKLNMNPMMGGFLGAVLVYQTIDSAKGLDFLGLAIPQIQYNTSVIPILLGVLFMKLIDLGLEKLTPKSIKFFVNPLLTMLIVVPVTLLWLGPLGFKIGSLIAGGLEFINLKLGWLSVGIIAAITPLLVMTGTNQALFPICIAAVSSVGYDAFVLPGMLAANVAVGASALAVATYSKNSKERQLGLSSGITGLMGITEPALFGILIKNKIALFSTMVAAGIAGFVAGLANLKQFAIVSPGIAALPTFIHTKNGKMDNNFIVAISVLCLSVLLSYCLTFYFGRRKQNVEERIVNNDIYLPAEGKVIPLDKVKDDVFSKGLVGNGFAIIPSNEKVISPVDGTITMVTQTKHAVGIKTDSGSEVLIHLGIDTVKMNGLAFELSVKEGQKVKHGDLLGKMDLNLIKSEEKDPTVIIVFPQSDRELLRSTSGKEKIGEKIGTLILT